jgi:hypothetical protein
VGHTVCAVTLPTARPLLVPPSDAALARRGGARSRNGVFFFEGAGPLPAPLRRFAPEPFTIDWAQMRLRGAKVSMPPGSVTLRPHQTEARDAIVAARRRGLPGFLLADEVGLGKTFSVLAAIEKLAARRSTSPLKVLVVAPLSVLAHWRRSIMDFGSGDTIWCVVNYEQARALLHRPESSRTAARRRTQNKRWAAEGRSMVAWDVVVFDEAHRLKNPVSQRSRAARQLVETNRLGRRREPAFTIWLSATAGQNPLELAYLASLLSARKGTRAIRAAEFADWCLSVGVGVRRGRFGAYEYDPAPDDAEKFHGLLFEPFTAKDGVVVTGAIRRRPVDLAGWPPLVRQLAPVELDPVARERYELLWEEFRVAVGLAASGGDPRNALTEALRFRQKSSLLRVPGTVQMVRDLLEDGLRPVVSVQFRETSAALLDGLAGHGVALLDGSVPAGEREARRVAFQRGELDVAVFSMTEGISLHAGETASGADTRPRMLLLHDLRWSALEMSQIEGRAHRDGQNAVARYLFAADTVEERMVDAVVTKLTTMARMLGDDTAALDALLAAAS